MKIGYMCPYEDLGCGESEARLRWTYLLEKKGCQVVPLNKQCRTFDTNEHADNLGLDVVITAQVVETTAVVYPNVPTCFFWWCPSSFFPNQLRKNDYLRYMGKYDFVVGGYESNNPVAALASSPYFSCTHLLPLMASVPADFVIPCEEKEDLKLFYVGMFRRYEKLLTKLESDNLVDIYGPEKVFGQEPWGGFKSYRGTIPYDGKTIIRKMHDAGIVLALHSKSHNREDFVSNRIFEAAAAGAIIIADDNKFIRKYFGDSVYYLNIFQTPKEQERELSKILDAIFNNKKEAFEKAKRAQKIFLEKLSLDKQVDAFLTFIEEEKNRRQQLCNKLVDCVVYVDDEDAFYHVQNELKQQCYTKLHLVIVAEEKLFKKIRPNISFDYSYCAQTNDNFSPEIVSCLKGEFFIILGKDSVLHHNHIFKGVQILSSGTDDFTYSGSYEKIIQYDVVQKYKTLEYRPYNFYDILVQLQTSNNDMEKLPSFLEQFPSCCFIFRRKIIVSNCEMMNMPILSSHLYLCMKSILLNFQNHSFMYTISSGKKGGALTKKFFYDSLGNPKDEILEKVRTNLCHYIGKIDEIAFSNQKDFFPTDVKIVLLKTLLLFVKFKKTFSINKKHRKKYREQYHKIKMLIQKEKDILHI